MSISYNIFTLSDNHIQKLINEPEFYLLLCEDESAYIDIKINQVIDEKGLLFKSISKTKLAKKLGLFQIDPKIDILLPQFSICELRQIWNLDSQLVPYSSWTPFEVAIVSYFMHKAGIGTIFQLMGEGLYLTEDEISVFSSSDLKHGITNFDKNNIKITIDDADLEKLLNDEIFPHQEVYRYYKENKVKSAKWIEACIKHFVSELEDCVTNGMGLVQALC